MFSLSNKAKQYLLVALKVLILGATFMYIYTKLSKTDASVWGVLISPFKNSSEILIVNFLAISVLVIANWLFEILKWKAAISHIQQISFKRAAIESLSALTISLTTPNRIGDYGAKAYYYPAETRKQILLLNFLTNGSQMLATCVFGCIGLVYIVLNFELQLQTTTLLLLVGIAILLAFLGYLFKERQLLIKGFSIANVWRYYGNIKPKIKVEILLFSFIRYVLFSYLFYFLLQLFGAEIPIEQAVFLIFAMYLFVSIIPSIFIFDVVIRGGVAVWLFSLAGVDEIVVLATVLAIWLLNVVLPAICGSYFVARYKPASL